MLPILRYIALAIGGLGAIFLTNTLRPTKRHRKTLHRVRKTRMPGR